MFSTSTTIGVVGAGAMGSGIAQVAAQCGHPVFVYDASKEQLEKASATLKNTLGKLVEKQKLNAADAEAIAGRIQWVHSLAPFTACGLVIEAIIERLDVKQDLFVNLEKVVEENCVLASNTSSLSITLIASACAKPERVIGIHFFNPAPLMPLVEIIPGIASSNELLLASKALVDSWGKSTVLVKDTPGFIVNRVARPYYGEAIRLYEEGVADFATIDWAMKTFGGFRMGPFELMDFIGNDINYKVTETVWTQFFFEPRFKPSFTQRSLFDAKRFGRKSGRGYYDYAPGSILPEPVKDEQLGKRIADRVLVMLINEAADALHYQVATRDDLDTAMTKGVNYPKGLLKWADEIGIANVVNQLDAIYNDYREDRYRCSVLLRRMAAENRTFY
jgi:3-hydroxybutyryl-CoA dehydrogenase